MNTFRYATDTASGEIQAESLEEAFQQIREQHSITEDSLADGRWAWVEDPETGRRKGTHDD